MGWTAISRPPYFTALALWFTGGAWNGGGIWLGNREVGVNDFRHCWHEAVKPAKELKVRQLDLPPSEDEPIFTLRLERHGWQTMRKEVTVETNPDWRKKAQMLWSAVKRPSTFDEIESWLRNIEEAMPKPKTNVTGILEKRVPSGLLRREHSYNSEQWSLIDDSGVERRSWKPRGGHPHWIDVDRRGRIVFGEMGCLWAWSDFPDGEPTLIADLNANTFESVPPPDWATRW
ncbi:hypothetical protein OP10G_3135 [Fimbriimonas ginsengisoli Gsoil 348]|uniref:Uncharacterized protein n=1 Tax=Fimbriimonas ginsengisoli Gsoil 348 TaxID=661478 RepID=A0A068NSI8_FIMGI|nr:hypothetical protein OP10G_3135 [Fimbriimonas ginsengisoli Gsoil 348]